jgi:hypothetical protein
LGGDWSGNTAPMISPYFPPGDAHNRLFQKIQRGEYSGKQVDWGAWAARVSKQQILDFIEETYRDHNLYTDATLMPHLYAQMKESMGLVNLLPEDGYFALVATKL